MNSRVLVLALSAIILVLNQFFLYPVLASEASNLTQVTEESSTLQIEQTPEEMTPNPIEVKITGNGDGSDSEINIDRESSTEIIQSNEVEIVNNIKITANTGDNEASDNTGDVTIKTGDVNINVKAINKVNQNSTVDECECETESPQPSPTSKPSETPSSSPFQTSTSSPHGGGGSGGTEGTSNSSVSEGGQILGVTLPETGGFSLFQATALALIMLLSGIILRLDLKKAQKYVKKNKIKRSFLFPEFFTQSFGKSFNFNFTLLAFFNLPARFKGLSPPTFF